MPSRGDTLLIPFNDVPHLFVVMNDPCDEGHCLTVMVTSIKSGKAHDPACVLDVGDHPFIGRPSYILYRMAETLLARHIDNMLTKNYFVLKDPLDTGVFQRIAKGLFSSDNSRPRIRRYAEKVGL